MFFNRKKTETNSEKHHVRSLTNFSEQKPKKQRKSGKKAKFSSFKKMKKFGAKSSQVNHRKHFTSSVDYSMTPLSIPNKFFIRKDTYNRKKKRKQELGRRNVSLPCIKSVGGRKGSENSSSVLPNKWQMFNPLFNSNKSIEMASKSLKSSKKFVDELNLYFFQKKKKMKREARKKRLKEMKELKRKMVPNLKEEGTFNVFRREIYNKNSRIQRIKTDLTKIFKNDIKVNLF